MLVKLLKATRMMGDGVDQVSGSDPNPKKATRLPLRVHSINQYKLLQESDIPDQSDVFSSADPQPKKRPKALQVCTRTYIPSLGQVQIGLQLCAGKPRVKCKFLRSPALSTGQAIGASLLSLARCGGLWDYPRALKAGLLHPTATNPDQLGSPSLCILCHAHLDCKPMAHLVVDCTHPTVFFARVDTQLLQAINDTRVQIFDCTLHTTTTTTTTTTTPASPSLSTTSSNSNPDSTGTSAIWDNTRFEPPISVAHSEIPRQAQDTVEENPTASRTTTTDTHTAAISSTPTPTQISYIGSDDILTVLLGGSLPGTNTAGNTEACPGQQWLTGTVEEGNLLSSNQPVAHRMCDFLQISVRVYRAMLWKHHKSNLSHIPDI
ncbi:hypothetical protein BASA61_008066 [Batrachochytrium salamandrivorans]|nr:hypothetical protein BASA61_008066 [Batrachochytrium salamandrivorans]